MIEHEAVALQGHGPPMFLGNLSRPIQRGVVTGNRKTLHPGKAVMTFALGSERVYEFLDNNPFIEAHPAEYVNDPVVVSQNDNMVAINSAIEVDLTGQVCSDSIGAYIYSGFGGQVDFIRGAARSKGGKPIIAVPATAKRGEMSATVESAHPLSDEQIAKIKEILKAQLGSDVALEASVDPELLGGLVVRVGSRMIDSSLRTKLNRLQLNLKEAS